MSNTNTKQDMILELFLYPFGFLGFITVYIYLVYGETMAAGFGAGSILSIVFQLINPYFREVYFHECKCKKEEKND